MPNAHEIDFLLSLEESDEPETESDPFTPLVDGLIEQGFVAVQDHRLSLTEKGKAACHQYFNEQLEK